jgi:hypothetical protein
VPDPGAAVGVGGLAGRRALPALILGSSVFLQIHLVLGLLLGPLAARAFDQARGPALAAAAGLAVAAVVFWRVRRRKQAAPAAWMEATCPACIAVNLLTDRVPVLAGLTDPDPVRPSARPVTDSPVADRARGLRSATRPAGRGPGSAAPGARRRVPR